MIENLLKSNPELEFVDARDMGDHPLCDVWLDGQVQGNDVVEMVAHRSPDVETPGAVKSYLNDADGNCITENGKIKLSEWKFGLVKWRPI